MIMPDIDHIETTPVITAWNQSWTADRTGYIQVNGNTEVVITSNVAVGYTVYKNDIVYEKRRDLTLTAGIWMIPVAAGETIRIAQDTGSPNYQKLTVYFVPPKGVTIEPPQLLAENYSFAEQKVGKWVDGKDLYQKSYNWNNPVSIAAQNYDLTSNTDGLVNIVSGEITISSGGNRQDVTAFLGTAFWIRSGTTIVIGFSRSVGGNDANSGIVTLWYTKD